MIADSIQHSEAYYTNEGWKKALHFLKNITPECDDGEYAIDGETVFARVMTYETKMSADAFPETHQKYVDIQVVLAGEERIFWNALDDLTIKTPYDDDADVAFYEKKSEAETEIVLMPGLLTVFFPQDAHTPAVALNDESTSVKKVVVKISVDCFT